MSKVFFLLATKVKRSQRWEVELEKACTALALALHRNPAVNCVPNPSGALWTARVNSRLSFSVCSFKGPFPLTLHFPRPHLPSAVHSTWTSGFILGVSGSFAALDGPATGNLDVSLIH